MDRFIKFKILGAILIALYLIACGYTINKGIHDIKVSAYKIGCMSVDDAPYESIRACVAQAESRFSDKK